MDEQLSLLTGSRVFGGVYAGVRELGYVVGMFTAFGGTETLSSGYVMAVTLTSSQQLWSATVDQTTQRFSTNGEGDHKAPTPHEELWH